MTILIIFATIAGPVVLCAFMTMLTELRWLFDLLAVVAGLTVGAIMAVAVYNINRDTTVMTTQIHAIFANGWFLLAGAYLGVYVMAMLLMVTWRRYREAD